MRNWIARTLGVCALAAALFAPVAKAEAPAATTAKVMDCTIVTCSPTMTCCNHCQVRNTICANGNDGR